MRYETTGYVNYEGKDTSALCVKNGVSLKSQHLTTAIAQDMYARYCTDRATQRKVRYFTGLNNGAEAMTLLLFLLTY